MEKGGDSTEIQTLKIALREVFEEALKEVSGIGLFPLYTTKELARLFKVSVWTIRAWVKMGELHPRYQLVSGRCVRMLFTSKEVTDFFRRNFPSPEDFSDHACAPRKGSKSVRLVERMARMRSLYARRRQPREADDHG